MRKGINGNRTEQMSSRINAEEKEVYACKFSIAVLLVLLSCAFGFEFELPLFDIWILSCKFTQEYVF